MSEHDHDRRDVIEVQCECGNFFEAPRSMKGGMANCPLCKRATLVPGGPEALFWWLLSGGAALVIFASWIAWSAAGVTAATATAAIGALILLIIVIAS